MELGSTGQAPGAETAEVCLEKRGTLPRQASRMPDRPANELLLTVPSSESLMSQGPFMEQVQTQELLSARLSARHWEYRGECARARLFSVMS